MIQRPQRISAERPRISGVMIRMPQQITLTSAERPYISRVMIPMPQRITLTSAERPRISRVMIQMPQRITSHLCRAPSHLWSDDSNAPADQPHMHLHSTFTPLE